MGRKQPATRRSTFYTLTKSGYRLEEPPSRLLGITHTSLHITAIAKCEPALMCQCLGTMVDALLSWDYGAQFVVRYYYPHSVAVGMLNNRILQEEIIN